MNVEELLSDSHRTSTRGVVQIESLDFNVGCSMFIANIGDDLISLAADHLTGG